MSTVSKHSPLLALPKELRLMIYDELFTPLIQRPKHFDTYVLPSEWPKIDFTSYRALLLTCKEVKEETTTHFEGHFSRDVMVFFDNLVDLRNFYSKLEKASSSEKLAEMQACLHTLPWGIEDHLELPKQGMALRRFRDVNFHTVVCCEEVLIVYNRVSWLSHGLRDCSAIASSSQNPPFVRTYKTRGSAKLDVEERTGQSGPFGTTFELISRQMCSKYSTMYMQMVAPFSCLVGHEGLIPDYLHNQHPWGQKVKETSRCWWSGAKEWEQELKEKYELDA
ncbi:hypothetical protein KC340_g4511 [Hortaea werneckii]|nr:hypothetical protein KC342_g4749 [Hortaea werneckii]KAI7329840.1 hypothetical protein KC340_g4511 [Hortaea werneckii]KAI7372286.1 hypothetical protein KC328_g17348 [Hortaea werneckii]